MLKDSCFWNSLAATLVGCVLAGSAAVAQEPEAPAEAEAEVTEVQPAEQPAVEAADEGEPAGEGEAMGEGEADAAGEGEAEAPVDIETLQITVRAVEGMVHYRTEEDPEWKPAEPGLVLDTGAEFRTGLRSAVQFSIPPDQVITLDRLSVVKVLHAIRDGDRVKSDLGMRYGRTSYEVEGAGVEHDATIRSPSATLAVRGTEKVVLTDQGPFPAYASSRKTLSFFNARKRKEIAFGSSKSDKERGFAADQKGPAEQGLKDQTNIPSLRLAVTEDEVTLFRNTLLTFIASSDFQETFQGSHLQETFHHALNEGSEPGGPSEPTEPTEPTGPFTQLPLFLGVAIEPLFETTPVVSVTVTNPLNEVLSSIGDTDSFDGFYFREVDGTSTVAGVDWTEAFANGTYTVDLVSSSGEGEFEMVVIQDDQLIFFTEPTYIGSDAPVRQIIFTAPGEPISQPTPQ